MGLPSTWGVVFLRVFSQSHILSKVISWGFWINFLWFQEEWNICSPEINNTIWKIPLASQGSENNMGGAHWLKEGQWWHSRVCDEDGRDTSITFSLTSTVDWGNKQSSQQGCRGFPPRVLIDNLYGASEFFVIGCSPFHVLKNTTLRRVYCRAGETAQSGKCL